MSKIALASNVSGTGTLTLSAPNTNSDRTLTLPDSAGTIATAESTLAQFSASGSAPVFAARAWVNFNGGATVSVRASGNVSSVTRFASGNYSINFATAMSDANYAVTLTAGFTQLADDNFAFGGLSRRTLSTASAATVLLWNRVNNSAGEADFVTVSIFR